MPRALFLHDPIAPYDFQIVWDHLRETAPDFVLTRQSLLDPIPRDLSKFDLVVPWLQDPLDDRPDLYGRGCALGDMCDEAGVPIVNRPENLKNARKETTSRLLRLSGLPLVVPRMDLGTQPRTFGPPCFLRENGVHSGALVRADTWDDVDSPEWREAARTLAQPVVVEYLETETHLGYAKYRYVVLGDRGLPLHVQMSRGWITRGDKRLKTSETQALEARYVTEDAPECGATLVAAVRALGLDFGAVDYAEAFGGSVFWEVNPMPYLHYIANDPGNVRNGATRRVLDGIVDLYRRAASQI
jgi:glutathione synthase/RimK-type ligase-like ATP-grasp enzyme